jgi:hypothetical protein
MRYFQPDNLRNSLVLVKPVWLEAYPKRHAVTTEGLSRTDIEPKLRAGIDTIFHHMGSELVDLIASTPALESTIRTLQPVFPEPHQTQDAS